MNIKSHLFFLIIFLFIVDGTNAQINPPDFLCVRNDSLFWEPPINDCGTFISYTIYFSTNESGPYTILDNTGFFTATEYEHPNPGGNLYYYYLVSNYDCPGEIQLTSDTLNTRPPEIGPIKRASVESGGVLLEWDPSPSPQVNSYIIYRVEDNGTFPIDTVFGNTQYIDLNAEVNNKIESYFVVAVDPCDNTSIFGESHSTVLLDFNLSACEREISLNWEPYNSWSNGVESQEIWVSINGATPTLVASLDGSENSFIIDQIEDNADYEIFVQAIEQSNPTVVARSNAVSFNASISEAIKELSVVSIRTNISDEIEINWLWNPSAELTQYDIVQTDDTGNSNFFSQNSIPVPLPDAETYLDVDVNGAEDIFSYQISTIDDCGDTVNSNAVKNIVLTCRQIDNSINEINWSPFTMERAILNSYKLYRVGNNTEELLVEITDGTTSFIDDFEATAGNEIFCYYVVAGASLELLEGPLIDAFVQSNRCCIERAAFAVAPNAFAPFGKNSIFKPLIFNRASLQSYRLDIWSRWGELIFTSVNPETGWNGQKDGNSMPQGVYPYLISLKMNNGDEVKETGSVLLLK